jgi:hypothetical protein
MGTYKALLAPECIAVPCRGIGGQLAACPTPQNL